MLWGHYGLVKRWTVLTFVSCMWRADLRGDGHHASSGAADWVRVQDISESTAGRQLDYATSTVAREFA